MIALPAEKAGAVTSLDTEKIRRDFPILTQTIHGKPLTFLDSAASAQKPRCVIDAISRLYETGYANIHRGIYKLSQDATEAYEQTREKVRALINARHSAECLFVRGATEGINLVAQSYGRAFLKEGDEIILSEMEHHSNIVPWQMLRDEKGLALKIAPVLDDGSLDMDAYKGLLSERTKFVAMLHISNAIGTQVPIKDVIRLAHEAGARVLVDGCQAVPHMAVDVQDLDADFYTFSGHKMYGPSGIGVLYGKAGLLDAMPPWQGGGDMIETVTFEKTTYNKAPHKFEAGTPHIAGGIALGAAIDYINTLGYDAIHAHGQDLLAYATKKLTAINSLRIIGTAPQKGAVISFVMKGTHPHDIGTILDREGIAVRTGHHCAQPIMERFGIPATARASFGLYNSREDVDRLVAGLRKVTEIFG